MKIVIYTQRVERIESYNETRDCADQNISRFIEECGYLAIPVSNVNNNLREMIEILKPVGIVLTGGNSLEKYGGTAPERDQTDRALIEIALEYKIPLYGFCRGMQSIIDYFGGKLISVEGHVSVKHKISDGINEREVNSYHNEAAIIVDYPLRAEYRTADKVIESIWHENGLIYGTMWHPEREKPFKEFDIKKIKEIFGY